MEESRILALYFARDEEALQETEKQYGKLCFGIAHRILQSPQDAEECVNDTLLRAWNSIPPASPSSLSAYLATVSRNLALDRYRAQNAEKRTGEVLPILDELKDCVSVSEEEAYADTQQITDALNSFLHALPSRARTVFLRRYWYLCPIAEIARSMHLSEGSVKVMLHRTRRRLQIYLKERGIL